MKSQSRIVLSDLHVPFYDRKLLGVWMERLEEGPSPHRNWDGVDIIGDFIDCYTLSRFDTNPVRKDTFQQEVDDGFGILTDIRKLAPNADIRYSEGNHEDRLRKMLWGKSKPLAHLRNLTISNLLRLDELGIKYHTTQNPYKIGDLWYTHGDILRKHAGQSARAKSESIYGSVMVGHCHRMGWSPYTTWNGITDAYECGHMADVAQLDYVRNVCFNWQAGWAEVHFEHNHHVVNFYRVVDRGRERFIVGPEGIIAQYRTRR